MSMNPKQIAQIKRALRDVWLRSPQRHEALRNAKERMIIGKHKNSTPKYKTFVRCALTDELLSLGSGYEVDHIVPVEPSLDLQDYVDKLFCDASNLQVVAKEAHKTKTKNERKNAKRSKAQEAQR